MRRSRAWIAISMTALLSLAGCATEITGSGVAATTISAEEPAAAPADSPEPEEPEATEPGESSAGSEEPPAETEEPVRPSQPGDETDEAAEASQATRDWFHVFCTGFGELQRYISPDTTGMTEDEAIGAVVDAYTTMSQIAVDTTGELDAAPAPDFPSADRVAPTVSTWFATVGQTYADGAQRIAEADVEGVAELKPEIDSIESSLNGVNAELGQALDQVDDGTRAAVRDMPECAALAG